MKFNEFKMSLIDVYAKLIMLQKFWTPTWSLVETVIQEWECPNS